MFDEGKSVSLGGRKGSARERAALLASARQARQQRAVAAAPSKSAAALGRCLRSWFARRRAAALLRASLVEATQRSAAPDAAERRSLTRRLSLLRRLRTLPRKEDEQLIEARDRIVLQLERSRKQLGDKVPAYRIRDLHRSMAVPLSSELRQDGLVLLNEYNLDKLDAYRYPTKKTVIVNSLVFEPFLEFTPKSEAMRAYVRALEDIVYADREVANAVIFGTNVRPSP